MTDARAAQRRVVELLAIGLVGDEALRDAGTVLEPIEVHDPDGAPDSWFCPIVLGDRLAGFAQLRPDLELLRFSTFARGSGDLHDLPAAAGWVDRATIARRAAAAARAGEKLGEPVLSYDRSPERIAWSVEATDEEGRTRTLYVSGDEVFEARESDDQSIGR